MERWSSGRGEREREAVDGLASALAGRRLQAPGLLLLEAARPFHLLIQQALYVAQPFLQPWLGDWIELWAGLMEDDEALARAAASLRRRRA